MGSEMNLSDRIFDQTDRLAIVADQLWKTNHETGCVNSMVAGWAKDEIMQVISQLDIIRKKVKEMETV